MRSPYGEEGRVRASLRLPCRDRGYYDDPTGEAVCNRLALVQEAQRWARELAKVAPPVRLTPGNRARRQEAARLLAIPATPLKAP